MVVVVDIYHQIGYTGIHHQIKTFICRNLTLVPLQAQNFHLLSISTSLSLLFPCTPLFTSIPNCNSVSPTVGTPASAPLVVRDCTSINHSMNLRMIILFTILSTMTFVREVFIVEMSQRALTYALS